MDTLIGLLPIVGIALVFWLLIIRPAQRRQKEVAQVQSSLAVGEKVVLTSGIVGVISEVADVHLMLEIAPGVVIKVARGAVGSVIRDEDADEASHEAPDEVVEDAPGTTGNEER